jgi:hypothetical protein
LAARAAGGSACPVTHLNRSGFSWSSTTCRSGHVKDVGPAM